MSILRDQTKALANKRRRSRLVRSEQIFPFNCWAEEQTPRETTNADDDHSVVMRSEANNCVDSWTSSGLRRISLFRDLQSNRSSSQVQEKLLVSIELRVRATTKSVILDVNCSRNRVWLESFWVQTFPLGKIRESRWLIASSCLFVDEFLSYHWNPISVV